MRSKLLCVGTVAFDTIETITEKTGKILGGAATYTSLSAAHFEIDLGVVSVVGADFPKKYWDVLKKRHINVDGVEIVPDGKTFFWRGRYHEDMNYRDTLEIQLNVLEDFKPVVPETYRKADVVMLGNLNPLVQFSVLDQMAERPALVVLDTMDFWMEAALNDLKNVLKRVDVLCINDQEAMQLTSAGALVQASEQIRQMGPRYVIIKKGEHGAMLTDGTSYFMAPAMPLPKVLDPTGAGDTFAGGFTGHLTQTMDFSFDNMKTAMIHASNHASFCVESFGTKGLEALTQAMIKERWQRFRDLTQYPYQQNKH